jgi:hypothetical protein
VKQLRITEEDQDYTDEFRAWLIGAHGLVETAEPRTLIAPDEFDFSAYHGLEVFDPNAKSFAEEFEAEIAWLDAYKGTFDFYLSLKAQYAKKGKLSPAQISAVQKAMVRDQERAAPKPAQSFSITPGTVIIVGKWLAKEIAQKAGSPRAHHALEIVSVLGETERAYKLKVKLSAQRTSFCGVCGKPLSNPESVADGIGPICAQKWDLPSSNLLALADALNLMRLVEVETWVPKATIKERKEP